MRPVTIPQQTTAADDAITPGELADSITRLTSSGEFFTPWPDLAARLILDDVGNHREPEYEDGAVYQDAYGEIWQYTEFPEGDCGWRSFTDDPVQFQVPKRPLRKLVPEPEPAAMAGQSRGGRAQVPEQD
jgi:hypothetical protein